MDNTSTSARERFSQSSISRPWLSPAMNEPVPNPELLHSLGRMVRGLSALFWGLPAALIVCIGTATAGWFSIYREVPPLATTGLLAFGLWQLDAFQKQERPWCSALDRAKLFALINFGLSPFVFWWNREPNVLLFVTSLRLLALSAWFFLFTLNTVLLRLGAMLPDETLRHETRQFTSLNHTLLLILLLLLALQMAVAHIPQLPQQLGPILAVWDRGLPWLLIFLTLLPLAMTMALLWKTKEVILDSVFGTKN